MNPQVITTLQGRKVTDDRGSVSFVNDFDPVKYGIRRFYTVQNHRAGFIRAWHGHEHEAKFAYVVSGTVLLKTVSIEGAKLSKFGDDIGNVIVSSVLSADNPQVIYIPPGYFNGFKTLTDDAAIIFFSDKTLEESKGDDIRLPWDALGRDVWEENYR